MTQRYMPAALARAHFTRERLQELFEYDPLSGHLIDKRTGDLVSGTNNHGYLQVWVDRALLLAHRVAWRLMTGEWPSMLDHINGNRTDNRWTNLREADHSLNAQNYTRAMRTNKCGLLGVCSDRVNAAKPWRAAIRVRGVYHGLGNYATAEEAHAAYLAAKARLHPRAALVGGGE